MKILVATSLVLLACYRSMSTKPTRSQYVYIVSKASRGQQANIWDPMRPFTSLVHLGCVTLPPLADLSDRAILRQLRSGDLRGLERLYRAYEGAVYGLGR